ncbi:hypothetical protein DKM44_01305 [Deinococcus irradiatisoli]|uniref:Uncharacterized protein n=1 Tax=Deinococcus irradiatisoli TaxID=2202254 RepID=A0A2Z3JEY0_9DEIO|nr:hypothetical protein DKM44_01305 [Deinococcus irradiatisoli]
MLFWAQRAALWLLAALLGALALGAFASLNPGAPMGLRALSAAEGVVLGGVLGGYLRGLIEALLAALAVLLAARPSGQP